MGLIPFFCFAFGFAWRRETVSYFYIVTFGRVMKRVWLSLEGHIKVPYGTSLYFVSGKWEGLWEHAEQCISMAFSII
jgi:hypothetical protein